MLLDVGECPPFGSWFTIIKKPACTKECSRNHLGLCKKQQRQEKKMKICCSIEKISNVDAVKNEIDYIQL
ncbi:unnamed protein product [Larinioides sclopetarius]|uniref:Uncharacterized protein n=1 Tax=Larinioides sclopetarius TaxID=280406 RepID=A0AAV2APP7_9ARAC